jgi:hypothetical protein
LGGGDRKMKNLRPTKAKVMKTLSQKQARLVMYSCNPIYSGSRGREIMV